MNARQQYYLTATSVGIAALATLAASTQSFLAWNARHDQLKSAVFAVGVSRCGEAITSSNEYVFAAMNVTDSGTADDYSKFLDAQLKLDGTLETLQLLTGPISREFSDSLERTRTMIQLDSDRIGRWHRKEEALGKVGVSISKTTNAIREACKLFVQNTVFK